MKMHHDQIYLNLLKDIQENGILKSNRTGIDTLSVFGRMIEFDVSESVPILTTKKLHLKSIIHELLWFISGDTNIKYLQDNGVTIWDEWADEKGDLGPVYGEQWRSWETFQFYHYRDPLGSLVNDVEDYWLPGTPLDQLETVITEIKTNPTSRRLLVSAWNAPLVWNGDMKLPPCHYAYQFIVEEDRLSLLWNQRSVDTFLGLPYNIASYTFLLYMVASITGYKPHRLIGSLGDVHLYTNHLNQVKEQLSREPLPSPTLEVNPAIKFIDDFKYTDILVRDYVAHPSIKGDIAV